MVWQVAGRRKAGLGWTRLRMSLNVRKVCMVGARADV